MKIQPNKITARNTTSIKHYFEEIKKSDLITREQELELFERLKAGDEKARELIIKAHLRFVISVAKMYFPRDGVELEDLIAEGNVGLMLAVDKFQTHQGNRFISYAVWWIRHHIQDYLQNNGKNVRVSANRINDYDRFLKQESKTEQKKQRNVSLEEVAEELGLDPEYLRSVQSTCERELSLNDQLDEHVTRLETMIDYDSPSPSAGVEEESLEEDIDRILIGYEPREKDIFKKFFGIGEDKLYTTIELARMYKISQEMVRLIKEKVVYQISKNPEKRNILKKYVK